MIYGTITRQRTTGLGIVWKPARGVYFGWFSIFINMWKPNDPETLPWMAFRGEWTSVAGTRLVQRGAADWNELASEDWRCRLRPAGGGEFGTLLKHLQTACLSLHAGEVQARSRPLASFMPDRVHAQVCRLHLHTAPRPRSEGLGTCAPTQFRSTSRSGQVFTVIGCYG